MTTNSITLPISNASSAPSQVVKPTKEKKKKKGSKSSSDHKVLFWATECKYQVILNHIDEIDWKKVEDARYEAKCNLYWIDVAAIHERFRTIQPWQIINHFPGMPNIARKNRMGHNLNKMLKIFPREYAFFPRTWILPTEMADFRNQFDQHGNSLNNKIFIIKPDAGCQGRGIFLTKTWDKVPFSENVVAQSYIKKPLLIEGFKFDLRLYCFVSSVKPLRAYLFKDGLVRMCTEEYVKPTKHNLDQSCMHLTNYAINKHNDSFQQPDADNDFSGTKRSLQWFMDWIRSEHGDAKADWLWRRMGVLCMRTILSILPTLSREYDQHFKSFNNVPIDIKKIVNSSGHGYATTKLKHHRGDDHSPSQGSESDEEAGNTSGSDQEKEKETGESDRMKANNYQTNNSKKQQQPHDGGSESSHVNGSNEGSQEQGDSSKEERHGPQFRGSRCFEVLGYDIMIDSLLNPWLIEVNHLPSFGTDSALDKDVKERLMQQVFSVLPAMSDDQQAYIAHHKIESEKRLTAQRKELAQQQEQEKVKKPTRPPFKKIFNSPSSGSSSSRVGETASNKPSYQSELNQEAVDKDTNNNNINGSKDSNSSSRDATDDSNDQMIDYFDEECTPERLQEIKEILFHIYEKYSPEKLTKIDRLLSKYVGHEEEFLRFVYGKYNVPPSLYGKKSGSGDDGEVSDASGMTTQETASHDRQSLDPSSVIDGNSNTNEADHSIASMPSQSAPATPNRLSRQKQLLKPRGTRSMSPPKTNKSSMFGKDEQPRDSVHRRLSAAWKSSEVEDAQFRAEVLSLHVPSDNDEWLKHETEKLNQFTRLFPLPSRSSSTNADDAQHTSIDGAKHEEGSVDLAEDHEIIVEEDDDDCDKEDKHSAAAAAASQADGSAAAAMMARKQQFKSASYEDIIFQAFLYDKRQMMRLRCPLPNRAKITDESTSGSGGFLPTIEQQSTPLSYRSSISTTGKGVPGWKAPPKPTPREPPKQPTQTQADAAKRLSQGLSVMNQTSRQKADAGSTSSIGSSSSNTLSTTAFSVVLDPQEYSMSSNGVYSSVYGQSLNGSAWPSTKANRLLEESRLNRMRLEAAKASSAAVLRQQVFYFDPMYGDVPPNLITAAGAVPDVISISALNNSNPTNNAYAVQDDNLSIGNTSIGGMTSTSSSQQQSAKYSSAAKNVGIINRGIGGIGLDNSNKPQKYHIVNNAQTLQGQLQGINIAAVQHHNNGSSTHGASQHTQEELLRQLFPSWF